MIIAKFVSVHFSQMTGGAAANKPDKDAHHLYKRSSLHGAHIIGCKERAPTLSGYTLGEIWRHNYELDKFSK